MDYVRVASHALASAEGGTLKKLHHAPPTRRAQDVAYGETAEMVQAELTMALHGRARRPVPPGTAPRACLLLCEQASRGGPRTALNIFTAALLYAVPCASSNRSSPRPLPPSGIAPRLALAFASQVSPELGAETAAALQTQKAVLAGLLFLCSTDEGRRLFEEDAALLLLHEAVFGLAFANDLEVQLLALQTLFKLAHLPKVAAFLCEPTPLQGILSLLHEERTPPHGAEQHPLHRRLLSCCLQLLTLLLASDAAAAHLEAFAPLPQLLEQLAASSSDPDDPVRLMAGPVRERLEARRRQALEAERDGKDCVVS